MGCRNPIGFFATAASAIYEGKLRAKARKNRRKALNNLTPESLAAWLPRRQRGIRTSVWMRPSWAKNRRGACPVKEIRRVSEHFSDSRTRENRPDTKLSYYGLRNGVGVIPRRRRRGTYLGKPKTWTYGIISKRSTPSPATGLVTFFPKAFSKPLRFGLVVARLMGYENRNRVCGDSGTTTAALVAGYRRRCRRPRGNRAVGGTRSDEAQIC